MKTVIVGAGISGLATAYALLEQHPDLELQVLEASDRPGGKVWTDKTSEGFLCERGVNAFLNNKPETLELVAKLGLSPLASCDASRNRFVYSEGCLRQLPDSPPAFLASNLLSLPGRLRVALETVIPRGNKSDESLAEFATRRLGREAFEKLIDPMASGVYAGDATQLSLKSCFPRIHEVENEYRSLILGLIRLQLKALANRESKLPSAGPSGQLTSFSGGMSVLTTAIASKLGDRLQFATPVASITRQGVRYTIHLSDGRQEEAARVILAAPAYAQSTMLRELAPEIAGLLDNIPYPSLAICCLGYKREKIKRDLNGFGFLVPSRERRQILGTLWDASIFPNRTPEGYALFRTMIGGARSSELAQLPEDKLVDLTRSEIASIMGIDMEPEFVAVYRHSKSIPQYVVRHAQRLATIESLLKKHPGLILTGNAYKGVSLNDCVANAYLIARSLRVNS